jgi:hypothetical protein
MRFLYLSPYLAFVFAIAAAFALAPVHAQVRPKALTGAIVVTVDGKTVTLTDAEKTELAQRVPSVKAALPSGDQPSVDWAAALTADQRTIVGSDGPEAWTPEALIARWRAGGAPLPRAQAAAQLEIAVIAQKFLAR